MAAPYAPEPGSWNIAGWTLILGGMFIAAWSTYGFETAICYTSEFKNPETDTFKAIFYSGLLCHGAVHPGADHLPGLSGPRTACSMAASSPAPVSPLPWRAWSVAVTSSSVIFVFLMIASLILIIITAMAGSSRTLYQGSVDGWLPKYLSHVNHNGAPTGAMWTDLCVNLVLLSIAATDATAYYCILAVSNCGYIIFNFLNLNAGWIHRIDAAT